MSSPYPKKIASIELGRVIAIVAVILIHSQLMTSYPLIKDQAWLGDIINQLARFAVPFFFIASGYFLQPKLENNPLAVARQYSTPLMTIWLTWSLVYLLMPFNLATLVEQGWLAERHLYWQYLMQTPLNSLLEGGMVHLWFIPALVIGVGILALLVKFNAVKWAIPIALALYVYGVLAGSYQTLTAIPAPFFTRNGPFFATLLITVGFLIRANRIGVSSPIALSVMLIGMLGHFVEAWLLGTQGVDFRLHDFLFSTPVWSVGLFMLLLANPNWGDHRVIHWLSQRTLGIYVSHLLMIIYMSNLSGLLTLSAPARDLLVLFGSIVLSVVITCMIERSPTRKLLLVR
ncbi:acyltransferase [Vibrio sp. WXL210]|uniref:acyltransferase n=1 Tax=Vibrio sp. WXL210 TaxID=3450709 RepID=UPI003EC72A89